MVKKVRLLPKTSSVASIGTCGHEFKNRHQVPRNLVGKPSNPENLDRFNLWKEQTSKVLGCAECPDCQASASLSQTRMALTKWTQWLRVAELPPLDSASTRALAFAESARAAALQDRVSATSLASAQLFTGADLATRILTESLQKLWPNDQWIDPQDPSVGSPAGYVLKESIPAEILSPMSIYHGRKSTPQKVLALWLLNRSIWPEAYSMFFSERRTQAWIAMKRSRRIYSKYPTDRDLIFKVNSDVIACRITAQLGHWVDPIEAWDFFVALRDSQVAEMVGDAICGANSPALSEIVKMGSSMAAISGLRSADFASINIRDDELARILGKF